MPPTVQRVERGPGCVCIGETVGFLDAFYTHLTHFLPERLREEVWEGGVKDAGVCVLQRLGSSAILHLCLSVASRLDKASPLDGESSRVELFTDFAGDLMCEVPDEGIAKARVLLKTQSIHRLLTLLKESEFHLRASAPIVGENRRWVSVVNVSSREPMGHSRMVLAWDGIAPDKDPTISREQIWSLFVECFQRMLDLELRREAIYGLEVVEGDPESTDVQKKLVEGKSPLIIISQEAESKNCPEGVALWIDYFHQLQQHPNEILRQRGDLHTARTGKQTYPGRDCLYKEYPPAP